MPNWKRIFTQTDSDVLLDALRECRTACVQASGRAPINEPVYRGAGEVMTAIDALAGVLTGDATYFHIKVAPSGYRPDR